MEPVVEVVELISFYLLTSPNYMWRPIVANRGIFALTRHNSVKCLIFSFPRSYMLVYLNVDKSGKPSYAVDLYTKFEFKNTLKYFENGKSKRTKAGLNKAIKKDCEVLDEIGDDIKIFASVDIISKFISTGINDVDDTCLQSDKIADIAVGLCAQYNDHEIYYITQSLLDADSTVGQMHGIVPLVSLDVLNGSKDPIMRMFYALIDSLWMEFSISSTVEWANTVWDSQSDGKDGDVATIDNRGEDTSWSTPFGVSNDGFNYGTDEDGKVFFRMEQIKEVDSRILNLSNYIPQIAWISCDGEDLSHKELRGLDHNIIAEMNGHEHTISRMYDGSDTFYFVAEFYGDKKIYGEVVRRDNYANYVLLESMMKSADIVLSTLGLDRVDDKPKVLNKPKRVKKSAGKISSSKVKISRKTSGK